MKRHRSESAPQPRIRSQGPLPAGRFDGSEPGLALVLLALVLLVQRRALMPMFGPDDLVFLESARGLHEWPVGIWRVLSGRWFWTIGAAWFGVDPAPWHVALWLLHGITAVAAYAFVRAHGASRGVGFAAASWFGVHPMVTDVLLPVSSAGEVLSALMTFTAVTLAVRGSRPRATAAIAVMWPAALLAKESVALIPLASWTVVRRRLLITLGLTGVAFGLLLLVLGQTPGGAAYRWGPGGHVLRNLFAYAGTALDLRGIDTDPAQSQVEALGLVALVSLALIAGRAWRDTRLPAMGITGFVAALGPVLLLRNARYAHYVYAAQLFLGVTLASLAAWGVSRVGSRLPNRSPLLRRSIVVVALCVMVVVPVVHSEHVNRVRYGDWIPELQLPRDPLLRKMVVISNALGSLERSLGPDTCRLLVLWPESSGYTVGVRSGIVPAPPPSVHPAPILESVLDHGLGVRAIFPQVREVRMTDTWKPEFRDWSIATSLVNGQIIVLGTGPEAHRRLAQIWNEWGYGSQASRHLQRFLASSEAGRTGIDAASPGARAGPRASRSPVIRATGAASGTVNAAAPPRR